jgi:hypothetical protein
LLLRRARDARAADKERKLIAVPPSPPSARAWVGREDGEEGVEEAKERKVERKPRHPPWVKRSEELCPLMDGSRRRPSRRAMTSSVVCGRERGRAGGREG